MIIPPRDPNARRPGDDYRYGEPVPDGEHDVIVLWNEDGTSKKGDPKMLVRFGVVRFGAKIDYHPVAGSWRLDNLIDALCPHLAGTGAEIAKGALKGLSCRASIKSTPGLKDPTQLRAEIVKLKPADGPAAADHQPAPPPSTAEVFGADETIPF